jgi:hypothetical protein
MLASQHRAIKQGLSRFMYYQWERAKKHPCCICGKSHLGWDSRYKKIENGYKYYCPKHFKELQ